VPGTLAALERVLRDPAKQVRLEAVTGLRSLGARESVPALLEALRDPDLHVQVAVVGALHELADVTAVPGLVNLLGDESEHVRRGAVEVLNRSPRRPSRICALRDADWWVRVRAADALGTLGGERVVAAATSLLRDPDETLRRQAIELLNAVPGPAAVPALIGALDDPDWWVSERAIDALGKSGDARALEPLVACTERAPAVAVLAARALGALADPRAVPALSALLDSPAPELRAEAQAALATFPGERLDAAVRARLGAASASAPAAAVSAPARSRSASRFGDSPHRLEGAVAASSGTGRLSASPQPVFRPGAIATFGLDFTDVPAGQEFLDRYTIVRRLGRGGYGTVYLALDRVLGEEVVLKVLNPQLSRMPRPRGASCSQLARRCAPRVIRTDFLDGRRPGHLDGMLRQARCGASCGQRLEVRRAVARGAGLRCHGGRAEDVVHRTSSPGTSSSRPDARLGLAAAHQSTRVRA
jgi:serine/threonine-protein kinase